MHLTIGREGRRIVERPFIKVTRRRHVIGPLFAVYSTKINGDVRFFPTHRQAFTFARLVARWPSIGDL